MWVVMGIYVYRHAGYAYNQWRLDGHEFQSICSFCKCSECGERGGDHSSYRQGYQGYGKPCKGAHFVGLHPATVIPGLPVTLALWPLFATAYGVKTAHKVLGFTPTFFVPAPEVKSRDEREAERALAAKAEKEKNEARIAELEAENRRWELEYQRIHRDS